MGVYLASSGAWGIFLAVHGFVGGGLGEELGSGHVREPLASGGPHGRAHCVG
jgi:hypothetical protein